MDNDYKDNQFPKLDSDDTPFSEPEDINKKSDSTHPQTDTNVDVDEVYHEGLGVAAHIDPADADEIELMGDSH